MTALLGVDVSRYQSPPLPWGAWVAGGLQVAVVQLTHGTAPEPHAAEHLAGAVAAGVPCIGGYHYLMPGDGTTQAVKFLDAFMGKYQFAALDVEEPGVSAADVIQWINWYSHGEFRPLLLYGNYSGLVPILNAHPELKRYGIWWAQYAAHDTPPAYLHIVGWQKLGSAPGFVGHLAPYADAIDLTDWFEWPDGRTTTMPKVMVPRGSLIAIHAINPGDTLKLVVEAVLAGVPYAAVKILNDAAALMQVKQASPTTWCYLRYFDPADDSLQGLDDWSIQNEIDWCTRVLFKIYSQITAEQCKWVDWACAWNEEDPPGQWGYQKLGETFLRLGQMNEARRAAGQTYVKLSFGCLAQGTPELWEMDELIATGLFAWMKAHGYSWDVHEGWFPGQALEQGMGDSLPSDSAHNHPGGGDVPAIAGSGSGNFRFVWMFEGKLRPLGQLVPLLIGEFYPQKPGQLDSYLWYDTHAAEYEYLTGFALYNFGHTDDWPDLTPDYLALRQHRIDIRSRINGPKDTTMPVTFTDPDFAALVALVEKYKPAPLWKVGDTALAVANPIQLYDAAHNASGKPRADYTSTIDVFAVSADGQWLQVLQSPALYVRAADVKHR